MVESIAELSSAKSKEAKSTRGLMITKLYLSADEGYA